MSEVKLPEHLKDANPDDFEIRRIKRGKGYCFVNGGRKVISDKKTIDRLKELGIPNTWSEVTLSSDPASYIQAKGYDGSDNLQYLYHPDFMEFRNRQKFANLLDFGLALPRIRRRLRKDLKLPDWCEEKLMALIVRILDKYHLRIGSRVYARKNKSFGLTTLRKRHLHEDESLLKFEFTGKSGQQREVTLHDPQLVQLVNEVAGFPGWELFSFNLKDQSVSANAAKVNDYIRNIGGGDFSARTFRTWAGTVLAVKYLPKAKKSLKENPKRKLGKILVDLVAEQLGNTPAICREYYIHPTVLEKATQEGFDPDPCEERFLKNSLYRRHECRTLEILSTR